MPITPEPDRAMKLAEILQDLIRIPSVFEEEHQILDWMECYIENLGIGFHRVPISSERLMRTPHAQPPFSDVAGRHNLVVRLPGRPGGRSLVINTHLDVVPAGPENDWASPPYGAMIDHDRKVVFGRGAMDDKAGVTIALVVMQKLAELAPQDRPGDVIFHFVLEDENTGNGSLLCLEDGHGADGAIIIDGTRPDRGINSNCGMMFFSIEVYGRPAAVSVSHMGINAADMLMALLMRLRPLIHDLNQNSTAPWDRFPSPNQFVTHSLWAEGQTMTVPDRARASCCVTFTPPFKVEAIRGMMIHEAELFSALHGLPPIRFAFDGFFACDPAVSKSADLESTISDTANRRGFAPIDFGPSTGPTDLRHFAAHGIPCVLYGPGHGFNPHRFDEHFFVLDLPVMADLLFDVALQWGAGP